jgi:hypothetical protein
MAVRFPSRFDRSLEGALEARLENFERAWEQRPADGPPPGWQDFLPSAGAPCPPEFLFWLLATDIECRIEAGMPALLGEPSLEEERLRQAGVTPEMMAELVCREYQLRWRRGDRARRRDYWQRFPQLEADLRIFSRLGSVLVAATRTSGWKTRRRRRSPVFGVRRG